MHNSPLNQFIVLSCPPFASLLPEHPFCSLRFSLRFFLIIVEINFSCCYIASGSSVYATVDIFSNTHHPPDTSARRSFWSLDNPRVAPLPSQTSRPQKSPSQWTVVATPPSPRSVMVAASALEQRPQSDPPGRKISSAAMLPSSAMMPIPRAGTEQ